MSLHCLHSLSQSLLSPLLGLRQSERQSRRVWQKDEDMVALSVYAKCQDRLTGDATSNKPACAQHVAEIWRQIHEEVNEKLPAIAQEDFDEADSVQKRIQKLFKDKKDLVDSSQATAESFSVTSSRNRLQISATCCAQDGLFPVALPVSLSWYFAYTDRATMSSSFCHNLRD